MTYVASGTYTYNDVVNHQTRYLYLTILPGVIGGTNSSLKVFPNPSNGLMTVWMPSLPRAAQLEIHSAHGQLLETREIPPATIRFQLDLRNHGAGVYMLRLTSGDKTERMKVIVQ